MAKRKSRPSVARQAIPKAQATQLAQSPVSSFEKLPPELRYWIYEMCIDASKSLVRSPLSKAKREDQEVSTLRSLFLLNKKISGEIIPCYYKSAAFVFGNHDFGSTKEPNLDGLKAFISRVDHNHLALITTIHIDMEISLMCYRPSCTEPAFLTDLGVFKRALGKHFTGLRTIIFQSSMYFRHEFSNTLESMEHEYKYRQMRNPRFEEGLWGVLREVLLQLLESLNVSKIQVFSDKYIPLHKAAEMILEGNPQYTKVLTVVDRSRIIRY